MTKVKKPWDLLTDKQRKFAIDEIIGFYSTERGEEIGIIAAQSILDKVLETSAVSIYNNAIDESKKLLRSKLDNLELDLDVELKK